MSRLLTLNLDFVLMLQSGLLFLLATASWGLARHEPHRAWRWLGWYGLAQCIQALVELVAFDAGSNPWSQVIRAILRVGSYLCLVEFARAASPRGPGRWIHLPIITALALAVVFGGSDLGGTWSRFVVAMIAAGWAVRTFWRWSRESSALAGHRYLRQTGLALVGYQLLVSLPGRLADTDAFSLAVGVPQEVVLGVYALILVIPLFRYHLIRSESDLAPAQQAEKRRRRTICVGGILLLALAGWIAADFSGRRHAPRPLA